VNQFGLTLGPSKLERADAARNRRQLLAVAREMLAEQGADKLTMDALAERAGLGKGNGVPQVRYAARILKHPGPGTPPGTVRAPIRNAAIRAGTRTTVS
jgi:hypothetical protein